MVITVTLNPAMDKTLNIDNFQLGVVNRVLKARQDIGGKGINVSKVLKNFGIDSISTGFLGGALEDYFLKELSIREINTNFTHIKGTTRTNIKIVDSSNGLYTDVNEPGPVILEEELNSFANTFESLLSSGDIVVLSGGVSPSIPKDIYKNLILIAKQKGAITVLDAEGELLLEGLKAKPDIIKPNNYELQKLLNINPDSEEEIINGARKLCEEGIGKILVSLGAQGAIYVTKDGVYHCEGLRVPVKSTVGAGDSMVAALVYSTLKDYDDISTLKFANACGAASVSLEGTEACSLVKVEELLHKTNVEVK